MKERITITVEDELLSWVDHKISEKIFANRSHALAYLVREEMNNQENREQKQHNKDDSKE